ncbi:MAG: prepilin peptidase [Deltaproteobacteria bacterium]|jgi:prepilin peptidase CpaA|nr:prepilin peptidase [Deltaproteobacteria bacterium]
MTLWLAITAAAILVAAAVHDAKTMLIPNWMSLAVAGLAVVNSVIEGSLASLGWLEAIIGLSLGLVLFFCKQMGAGDVKLASAALLWLPGRGIEFLVFTSFIGLLVAVACLIRNKVKGRRDRQAPYGVAIGGAAVLALLLPLILV